MIHTFLLMFVGYNFIRYVMRLNHKPLSILVFYFAATVALIATTVAFAVIKNPTNAQISTEFSSLFVSEWGIQIIGVSQALQALELVFLMRSVTSGVDASENRE